MSHDESGVLEIVTKSAVMNRLVTPSNASSGPAKGSSSSWPVTKVLGPSTGRPTVNFRALGLGVGSIMTDMGKDGTG